MGFRLRKTHDGHHEGKLVVGKNEKLESFKLESLKFESFCLSWKEPSEVGKNQAKLERTDQSWKVSFEVGKFR